MTPTQPRTKAGKALHERWDGWKKNGCRPECAMRQGILAIEDEAVSEYREALERITVAAEEVYGAENLNGEPYHDLLEPEFADQLRDAIEQTRAILQADQVPAAEPGR